LNNFIFNKFSIYLQVASATKTTPKKNKNYKAKEKLMDNQPPQKRVRIENDELSKMRKEIINEGINKKSYSSAEEESDSDSDSSCCSNQKYILTKKKSKKNENMDITKYAFKLNEKLSKMRSELARTEERLRYLQLEYNNKEIKIEELEISIKNTKEITDSIMNDNKRQIFILNNESQMKTFYLFLLITCYIVSFFF